MNIVAFLFILLVRGLAVFTASYVIPGVEIASFGVAVITAIVLGVLNTFLRPILIFLTLPVNILTLGLFTLVINILIILLTSRLVPEFSVSGLLPALVFSIMLVLTNWFLSLLV
ncbi:MAG: phage holin family protein [Patescibacteria group bacterium]|nr:phage holin family protein [Patescibacteria group bacterium]